MILSNEPGYYKAGEYGIRIENLVWWKSAIAGAEGAFCGFETLTFVPIDRALVDLATRPNARGGTPIMPAPWRCWPAARRRRPAWLEAACAPI
jgi:Xaa-Pro aminopeptidase